MQPAVRRHSRWVKNVNAALDTEETKSFPSYSFASLSPPKRRTRLERFFSIRRKSILQKGRREDWNEKESSGGEAMRCSDWDRGGSPELQVVELRWLSSMLLLLLLPFLWLLLAMLYCDVLAMQTQVNSFVFVCVFFFGLSLLFLRALGGAAATECVGFVPSSTTHSFNDPTCRRPSHLLQHNTHENY